VGAELLRADGRTDNTKLIVAFRKVENAPKRRGYVIKVLKETAKKNAEFTEKANRG
jgi:hypothetical protein